MQVPFVRFDASMPAVYRAFPTDAGADLFVVEETPLAPRETKRVALNLAVAISDGYYGMISGRSSVAARGILVHVGTVDQGYRGQLFLAATNLTGEPLVIQRGERIGQLIIIPFVAPEFVEVGTLEETERAGRGWGSTGR
ncbi:MAG: deoxyuridine 5'-triphosphate nucleotidohydrolase [Dehalococcoidales bacterium]|nr:deoxyuridine 5'-triphosphate nucleotidohydrolase [Dehalococcoidales bacterium]